MRVKSKMKNKTKKLDSDLRLEALRVALDYTSYELRREPAAILQQAEIYYNFLTGNVNPESSLEAAKAAFPEPQPANQVYAQLGQPLPVNNDIVGFRG